MNWILCSGLYVSHTSDQGWLSRNARTLSACLRSLQNRDHPDPTKRNGLMGLDAARCAGGSEITTYDSLDASLGQARNNVYLGVKGWACYLVLAELLGRAGDQSGAHLATASARLAADTIVRSADEQGLLPAVIGEDVDARIIPAIEGLIYPFVIGIEHPFKALETTLVKHLKAVLDSGTCRFKDGGWRLSSTSRNSWLSKIYLCQYIAERLMGLPADTVADEAHMNWLLEPENAYYAWSDQMLEGKAVGSRYYPRGVTSILWLASSEEPLSELADLMRSPGMERV